MTFRARKATPAEVPPNFILGTGQQALREAPLLRIDLHAALDADAVDDVMLDHQRDVTGWR